MTLQRGASNAGRGTHDRVPLGDADLVLTLFVAVAGLLLARLYPLWRDHVVVACPLLEMTGLPCPTCGGTRALAALVAGDWAAAFAWNPGVAAAGVVAAAWLPLGALLLALPGVRPGLPVRFPATVRWGLPLLLAANWVYLGIWFRG